MTLDTLSATVELPDVEAQIVAARRLEGLLLGAGPGWDRLARYTELLPLRDDWVEVHARTGYGARASREAPFRYLQVHDSPLVEVRWGPPGLPLAAFERELTRIPYTIAVAHAPGGPGDEPWATLPSIPLVAHLSGLGWGLWLKGAGLDRLVSPRWITHGPWRHRALPDGGVMLQLCDLAAPADVQVAQAGPAREHFRGRGTPLVWLPKFPDPENLTRPPRWSFPGTYDPERRVWRGHTLDLGWERLNIYALWRARCRVSRVEPVANFVFEFEDAEEAAPHLHALWLHGFEVVVRGTGERLDLAYDPPPSPPAWVAQVEAAEAR